MGVNRYDKFGIWCFITLTIFGLSKYLIFINPSASLYFMSDPLLSFIYGVAAVGWLVYPVTLISWPDRKETSELEVVSKK